MESGTYQASSGSDSDAPYAISCPVTDVGRRSGKEVEFSDARNGGRISAEQSAPNTLHLPPSLPVVHSVREPTISTPLRSRPLPRNSRTESNNLKSSVTNDACYDP